MPNASADGPLSPLEFAALTRTVYSVRSVRPVSVSLYRLPDEVVCSSWMLVAGSLVSCRDESNSSLPDFHWILNEVVEDASDVDHRTSSSVVRML